MAYWFDVSIEENVYLTSLERADGNMLDKFKIAQAETYSEEEKLKLPDIVRVLLSCRLSWASEVQAIFFSLRH